MFHIIDNLPDVGGAGGLSTTIPQNVEFSARNLTFCGDRIRHSLFFLAIFIRPIHFFRRLDCLHKLYLSFQRIPNHFSSFLFTLLLFFRLTFLFALPFALFAFLIFSELFPYALYTLVICRPYNQTAISAAMTAMSPCVVRGRNRRRPSVGGLEIKQARQARRDD